jgi:NADP-dependent 3-hydroxy acid dehydrogenase YdfG
MIRPSAIVVGVGAEQGLGGALSRRFAEEGYHVVVAGRTLDKIAKVADAIVSSGGSAEAVVTDATDESNVVSLFEIRTEGRDRATGPRRFQRGYQPQYSLS